MTEEEYLEEYFKKRSKKFKRRIKYRYINKFAFSGPDSTEPETDTFLAAMTDEPTDEIKSAINTLVAGIKASSFGWAGFDRIWGLPLPNEADHNLDLINPGTDSMAASGTNIRYERNLGYFGVKTDGLQFVANTANVNTLTQFTQNDGHMSVWVTEAFTNGVAAAQTQDFSCLIYPISSNKVRFRLNDAGVDDHTVSGFAPPYTMEGWYVGSRYTADPGNRHAYINGTQVGVSAVASAAVAASKVRKCANLFGKVSILTVGAGMTAAQAAELYPIFKTFMETMGAYQDFAGNWSFDWTTTPSIKSPEGYKLRYSYYAAAGANYTPEYMTQCVYDWERVPFYTLESEVPFSGYRRVRNLLQNTATLSTQGVTVAAGTHVLSFTGTGTITYSGVASGSLVGQGASARVSKQVTTTAGTLTCTVSGDVRLAQLENVTYQSNQNPGEYVSHGVTDSPYHGANRDGIKYFTTQNGNTVASELVTEATGAALSTSATGLEMWFGSKNICLQSENFGTTWVAVGTPTRSAAAKQCGPVALDLIGDDDGAGLEGYTQVVTFGSAATTSHGLSTFIAKGTSAGTVIRLRDTTAGVNRFLGVVTWSGSLPVVTVTTGSKDAYESLRDTTTGTADGVFRIPLRAVGVIPANTNQIEIYPASDAALDTTLTGNVYVGGVQVEDYDHTANSAYEVTFSTAYMPTTTAFAARADVRLQDNKGAGLSWPNQSEGTFVVEATIDRSGDASSGTDNHAYLFNFHNTGGTDERTFINLYPEVDPHTIAFQSYTSGVAQTAGLTPPTWADGETHKMAVSYKVNGFYQSIDGGAVDSDTSGTLPALPYDGILIGNGNGAQGVKSALNGRLRKFAYYRTQYTGATTPSLVTLSTI